MDARPPTHRPRLKLQILWLLAGLVVASIIAAPFILVMRRMREENAPYQPPERHPAADTDAFSQYAGSASCAECHREAYDLWQKSNHGMAERVADPALDERAFAPARGFTHGTQQTAVGGSNGAYTVTAVGLSRQPETNPVVRVIGHDPLRQFLVSAPGGRLQTLEASYDPLSNAWFNVYGAEDRQPGEWGHWTGRGMNWNNMCAACHNTRVRKNYDPTNDSYRTTMAELTVGCEACHGPMKAHVDWSRAHPKTKRRDPTLRAMTPAQDMETCGTCHARRAELTGDFVPGDRFDDHHVLTVVDGTDTYYPDGQVREENYEYAAYLGSKMAHAGVRCVDCHQPHAAKPMFPGNLVCMRCHVAGGYTNAPVIDPVAHSFHKVDALYGLVQSTDALERARLGTASPSSGVERISNSELEGEPAASRPRPPDVAALAARDRAEDWKSGGECVNCHMPQTYYMQRHRRHDHGMTIPDPLLTKLHGVPNACNRCHTDKSVDWAQEWTQKWYGSRMDRFSRRRAQVVAAARAGEPRARDGLLYVLATDSNVYWQAVAAGLLREWAGEPAVVTALTTAAQHADGLVRAQAAASLGNTLASEAGSAVAPTLARLLEDPLRAVRHAAQWALRGDLAPDSVAGRELGAALDYAADQPLGRMQQGAYALARGNLPEAAAHYRRAVSWDPNSAPIRHDFGVVLAMQGDFSNAMAQLESACRLEPQDAEFRYKLALAWNELGQPAQTVSNLLTAVRLDHDHGRAWYNLGLAYAGENDLTNSASALQRAVDHLGGPEAPYALATVAARQGNIAAARTALAEALRRAPGHAPSQRLRQELERP